MHKARPIYNFGAGPACLPETVLNQIREDIPNWYEGMSVMEISHRLPIFEELTQRSEYNLRKLLQIPDDFSVLFMHGGASAQFSLIPLNILRNATCANYLVSGYWSELAYQEAKRYCQPHLVASSKAADYLEIPAENEWSVQEDAAYFYYTDNETVQGVEFKEPPSVKKNWLVSDMTSNIGTKPIDYDKYALIYAGAQKNLGTAGITIVIVRTELLGCAHPLTPAVFNYANCLRHYSLGNTPPVFSWYVLDLTVQWTLEQGGCATFMQSCEQKSKLIYDLIDESSFYTNSVNKAHRSRINISFRLPSAELEEKFLREASGLGLKQLNGHKTVGGCRVSLYNAMPLAGVKALAEFMRLFEKHNG